MDYTGCIKAYAVVDLQVMGAYDWRLSDKNVWKVEQMLLDWPHRPLVYSTQRVERLRKRYVNFRDRHDWKPWRYYTGRQRWAPLPREFSTRG